MRKVTANGASSSGNDSVRNDDYSSLRGSPASTSSRSGGSGGGDLGKGIEWRLREHGDRDGEKGAALSTSSMRA